MSTEQSTIIEQTNVAAEQTNVAAEQTNVTTTETKTDGKKVKKSRKGNSQQMALFVRKVLKILNKDAQISKDSCLLVNSILVGKIEEISSHCMALLRDSTHKKTLKMNTIQDALRLEYKSSPEILQRCLVAGAEAVETFTSFAPVKQEGKNTAAPTTTSKKANLNLPVKRISKLLKTFTCVPQISKCVAVFLTGAMEYYIKELFINALDKCSDDEKKIIRPRHFPLGLQSDLEMKDTLGDAILGCGTGHGVVPGIVPAVEKNAYKKAVLQVEAGMIEKIPAEIEAQEKKRLQKLKETKKRKATDAPSDAKSAKKQKVVEASA